MLTLQVVVVGVECHSPVEEGPGKVVNSILLVLNCLGHHLRIEVIVEEVIQVGLGEGRRVGGEGGREKGRAKKLGGERRKEKRVKTTATGNSQIKCDFFIQPNVEFPVYTCWKHASTKQTCL